MTLFWTTIAIWLCFATLPSDLRALQSDVPARISDAECLPHTDLARLASAEWGA